MNYFNEEQHAFWKENGFIHLKNHLSKEKAESIGNWVLELDSWPETPGKWMKYFERSTNGNNRQLCRVENFIPYHDEFKNFLCGKEIYGMVSELMNEEAVLFKEKINYKYPGGGGFAAHQDAPAFTAFKQSFHITMLISIDPATRENGCLEMVHGYDKLEMLKMNDDLTVHDEEVKKFNWHPLETSPGDIVFFNSFVPHRSFTNHSKLPRRALYITYNRKSEGEKREDYYIDKREKFPQECERIAGKDYGKNTIYNVANPIR